MKRGAWVAQRVEHLTLDLGSGQDLSALRLSPSMSSFFSRESA